MRKGRGMRGGGAFGSVTPAPFRLSFSLHRPDLSGTATACPALPPSSHPPLLSLLRRLRPGRRRSRAIMVQPWRRGLRREEEDLIDAREAAEMGAVGVMQVEALRAEGGMSSTPGK